MKKLLLTSLLALSTTAAIAEEEWTVLDNELYMCDVLVSHYTEYPFEVVQEQFVRYYDNLNSWYNPARSEVFSTYQFSKIKRADCTSLFRGDKLEDIDKVEYQIYYQTSLSEDTIDAVEFTVHVEWLWDERNDSLRVDTVEYRYINDEEVAADVQNDPVLRKVLLESQEVEEE